jgi:hypothetical protein
MRSPLPWRSSLVEKGDVYRYETSGSLKLSTAVAVAPGSAVGGGAQPDVGADDGSLKYVALMIYGWLSVTRASGYSAALIVLVIVVEMLIRL